LEVGEEVIRKVWRLAIAALGLLLVWSNAAGADTLVLDSEPGDFVGEGRLSTFTDGLFTLTHDPAGVVVNFQSTDRVHWWTLDFAPPRVETLGTGFYDHASRYPFNSPTYPGLSVYGEGRGCNKLTGRFVVREIEWDLSGEVVKLAADFEQHCEGLPPALRIDPRELLRADRAAHLGRGVVVLEGDVGSTPTAVTVSVLPRPAGPVTVAYATADGAAIAGSTTPRRPEA
jgi:hypothetical protein